MNNRKIKCAFITSSTNGVTKKAEPPDLCKKKGCAGIFRDRLPKCESFLLPPGSEGLQAIKTIYEFARERISISGTEEALGFCLASTDSEIVVMATRTLFRHYHNLGNQESKSKLARRKDPNIRRGIMQELKEISGY